MDKSEGKKLRTEEEVLCAMRRTHQEICRKYVGGQQVDILTMQDRFLLSLTREESTSTVMDMVIELQEPSPPDPTTSQLFMDVDEIPPQDKVQVVASLFSSGM